MKEGRPGTLVCGNEIVEAPAVVGCGEELGDAQDYPDGNRYRQCLNDKCEIWGWWVANNPEVVVGASVMEPPDK